MHPTTRHAQANLHRAAWDTVPRVIAGLLAQGYTLPSRAFPQLPVGSGLNETAVAALQTKASALQITIVAEVDLPGHSTSLLKQIPALAAVDGSTGKACASINVTSADALAIMQTLLSEVAAMFPGPWLHLGADEVNFSDACNFTKANYHGFINHMSRWAASTLNRTVIVWGGFDPMPGTSAPAVDSTVVVSPFDVLRTLPWPHRPHHYFDAGYRIINTAWTPLYVAGTLQRSPTC